jgi:MFS family permease
MIGEAITPNSTPATAVEFSSELLITLEPSATDSEATSLSIPAEKAAIRTSLQASTWDGMFATVFSNAVGGVLLSNFLVELHATPTQIGMLASIPMVANLIQPIGAWWGDRFWSRHWYCFWVYIPARLLWLLLVGAIWAAEWGRVDSQTLILLTLAIVSISHFVGALGSAAWLSWMATLVPRRLRGRYFGIRNSAASLTNLVSVPLLGWFVAAWGGGSRQGYGVVVLLGIVAGLISIGFQFWMVDVNPQIQRQEITPEPPVSAPQMAVPACLRDRNFLCFLLYFGVWMFAVNLSAPFFNLYLLENLQVDLRWVTIYNSLQAGANLLMLMIWGPLADRLGNRALLLGIGVLVALTPLLWLMTGANGWSLWILFPGLHILAGATWAGIDLCSNNLQLGVAPVRHQSSYFAIAAAISGGCGALGTTAGGFLVESANYGGIPGLFALSGIVRLLALLPLIFVHEQRGQSFRQLMRTLFPTAKLAIATPATEPAPES